MRPDAHSVYRYVVGTDLRHRRDREGPHGRRFHYHCSHPLAAALTPQRLRTGGTQTVNVVHQQARVEAVIAGKTVCALSGQSTLAATALVPNGPDEYVKIICMRSAPRSQLVPAAEEEPLYAEDER
jgi:hypothetical protein